MLAQDLRKSEGVPSGQVAGPSKDQHKDIQVKQPDIFTPKVSLDSLISLIY